jgi:hypothetical protein
MDLNKEEAISERSETEVIEICSGRSAAEIKEVDPNQGIKIQINIIIINLIKIII